jgi:hypothetical protein
VQRLQVIEGMGKIWLANGVTEKGFISFAAGERRKRKGQGWSPRK